MNTLQTLLQTVAAHGDTPALIALRKRDTEVWSCTRLADRARQLASGFAQAGLLPSTRVLLIAPNSPEWIVTCLALLAATAVPVPVDAQLGDNELRHVLHDSAATWVVTTQTLARRLVVLGLSPTATVMLLDATEDDPRHWRRYLATEVREVAPPPPTEVAVLFYTSGTTGAPKGVPLTHRNLTTNLDAFVALGLLHATDRVLLPLPLHHVYAFTIGMLASLTVGAPLVMPASLTGPEILRALQYGQVTALLGVPRFYEALVAAIEARMRQRGRAVAALFHGVLRLCVEAQRRFGLRLGHWLFAPLRRRIAPHVRVVASAGAALSPALAWQLEGLGWQVGSGYGLTETSPILTFYPPGSARHDTAGTPIAGVELRIAEPEKDARYGEVLAKGPNVFAGYLHLPDKTARAFTTDGYFRTGDIGYLDPDGYLHLVGRASDMIVLAGGENIRPEIVEDAFAQGEHIREVGVLEHEGRLVALIVPEPDPTRWHAGEQVEEIIRTEVEQLTRTLPSYHRLSDYALTRDLLPRTRLGKLRRHLLTTRYGQAKQTGNLPGESGPLPITQMAMEDQQLLEDATAQRVWEWLAQRFPDVRLTPGSHLQLDLGIDSLAWLHLTLELRMAANVDVTEDAISRTETVRDLLREVSAAEQVMGEGTDPLARLRQPEAVLSAHQRQWLEPPGVLIDTLGSGLFTLNRLLMRWLFRLTVHGQAHLPSSGPFMVTPNHLSLLDALVVAAALPTEHLRHTYWGGWTGILFTNWVMRAVSRLAHVVPIDPQRGSLSNLAFAVAALQRG
ncbi:MAG: AMP-binding protein, partial [Deltaproteobacteria bacterium]|nr:AMP-binding protein [Deltaproteobacteria bacterium]